MYHKMRTALSYMYIQLKEELFTTAWWHLSEAGRNSLQLYTYLWTNSNISENNRLFYTHHLGLIKKFKDLKCGPWPSGINSTWEFIRNAESQQHPQSQSCWVTICILTKFPSYLKLCCKSFLKRRYISNKTYPLSHAIHLPLSQ